MESKSREGEKERRREQEESMRRAGVTNHGEIVEVSIEVCEVPAQAISLPAFLLSPVNLLVDECGGAGQADLVVLQPHLTPVSGPPLACSRRQGGEEEEFRRPGETWRGDEGPCRGTEPGLRWYSGPEMFLQ